MVEFQFILTQREAIEGSILTEREAVPSNFYQIYETNSPTTEGG